VSLGISTTAYHWLSSVPCKLNNTIHCQLSTDLVEKETWKNQAKRDWDTLLRLRSLELKTGAMLIVSSLCWDDDGHVFRHSFGLLNQAFQTLVERGILSHDLYKGINIPAFIRTKDEYCTISEDIPLQLAHCNVYTQGLPICKAYQQHQNLDKFSGEFVEFIKCVYQGLFKDQLLSQNVTATLADHVTTELWLAYFSLIREHSTKLFEDACFITVVFSKK